MCLIRVKPELDPSEPPIPTRVATSHRNGRTSNRSSVIETIQIPPPPPPGASLAIANGHGARLSVDGRSAHGRNSFNRSRETQVIQHRPPSAISHTGSYRGEGHRSTHGDRDLLGYQGSVGGSRASVISTQSRERGYYVDGTIAGGRSPRSSYRYIDGRSSAQRLEVEDAERSRGGDRYGYNNYHGRRSGSVSYVNPRHSHRSVRSTGGGRVSREKVVVVDSYGEKEGLGR
ncbi:Similar to hypothetical protein [Tuber melanosporum Mel28]; acc. no. XP_002835675 [Pyronema omphalodes CBS 100304]|uniref:Uncharacterized protein n=1 Tax=Pyronema omphalodes (strain CBS 100304) TaxID=1076935 RepID=U4L8K3_PYROM|nr:Similar to hypothetical protein [Tuber melanosporum Mel28]; acc. no. XP_002835675 [Pyronema omphalodes CBS 100304]